jgi:carbon monoxide dehydrogenase subunit G
MARVDFTVHIARPREEVFAYLTDVENVREWQPATEEVRRDTDGPLVAGSTYVQAMRMMGRRLETRIEVVELEAPSRFAIRTSGGPVNFGVTHHLDPDGEATRLRVEGEGEAGGALKLGGGMAVRAAERELKKSFERLKSVLESRR